jgi:acetate kinase
MILTVNCGSSTLKYKLFSGNVSEVRAEGQISRIGGPDASIRHIAGEFRTDKKARIRDHRDAFALMTEMLHTHAGRSPGDLSDIEAVGHRAVHGSDLFTESTVITEAVIHKLEQTIPLAPLHNPPNLTGIREAMKLFPDVPHVAVFDTAFNQTMPEKAYLYALPYELSQAHTLRRFGFHGTSCRYVSLRTAEMLSAPVTNLRIVVCHLGNGVTVTAVSGGKVADTSIGFATLGGAMMGTRSGDIDPGLVFHLHRNLGMSLTEIEEMLYRKSGLLGISGVSNDMRVIEEEAAEGNARCRLAIEMFSYRVRSYIGAYAAAMGGVDALAFTAGIGENSPRIREDVCANLGFLGLTLDHDRNTDTVHGQECIISRDDSPHHVVVVPTDEEKMIALDTCALAGPGPVSDIKTVKEK